MRVWLGDITFYLVPVDVLVQLDSRHRRDSLWDRLHDVQDLCGDPRRSHLAGSVRDHRDLVRLGQGGCNLCGNLWHHLSAKKILNYLWVNDKRKLIMETSLLRIHLRNIELRITHLMQ